MTKRIIAGLGALVLVCLTASAYAPGDVFFATSQPPPQPPPEGTPDWYPMPLGGVGFTTAVYFANDGTAVARTDAGGNWIKQPGAPGTQNWSHLLTYTNTYNANGVATTGQFYGVPGASSNRPASPASYEIAIAPSNSQVILLTTDAGYLWLTTDGGTTFSVLPGFQKAACATYANVCQTSPGCTQLHKQDATVPAACAIRTISAGGGCTAPVCPVANGNEVGKNTGPHFAIDPINPNYMAVIYGSLGLFISQDGGATWTWKSAPGSDMVPVTIGTGGNAHRNHIGGYVCFDPSSQAGGKTSGIYAYIQGVGVFHSGDSGSTWDQANGLNSTGMPTDEFSMTCGSGRIYLTKDTPRNSTNVFIDIFIAGTPGVWTSNSDTSAGGRQDYTAYLAFDPNDTSGPGGVSGRLIAIGQDSGQVSISANPYAATPTWSGFVSPVANRSCPPGLGNQSLIYAVPAGWLSSAPPLCFLTLGNGSFDPSVTTANQHIMYVGIGVGIMSIVPEPLNTKTNANQTWTFRSLYEENGNGISIRSGPGIVVGSFLDRAQFIKHTASWGGGSVTPPGSDLDIIPNRYIPTYAEGIEAGRQSNYASAHPNVWVTVSNGHGGPGMDMSAISTDYGETWNMFRVLCSTHSNASGGCASNPPYGTQLPGLQPPWEWDGTRETYFVGGPIATLDGSSIVFVPGLSSGLYHNIWNSHDGGSTWTEVTPPGVPLAPTENGWSSGNTRNLCEDGTNYYLFNHGTSRSATMVGVWISSDGGTTWTQTNSGYFSGYLGDSGGHLSCVPGHPSDLWYDDGNPGQTVPTRYLYRISSCTVADCKTSKNSIPNVADLWAHGWGAPSPTGDGYPSLYIIGWVRANPSSPYIYGFWRSDNADQTTPTWTKLEGSWGSYPLGYSDRPTAIDGDKNVWNSCFVSFLNTGLVYWK
jgi:hypothetical protein